jgi:acetyl-CoA carboxylase biotin carboxyl carrier protein
MGQREEVAGLVALVDRLEHLLDRTGLSELELEVDGKTVVLRSASAVAPTVTAAAPAGVAVVAPQPAPVEETPPEPLGHAVVAPLTGVFYLSPTPEAEPYVREGGQVNAGQVIGLIEAMKLFNEIKSDVTGAVKSVAAGDGDLVKAKQTLIVVEPS